MSTDGWLVLAGVCILAINLGSDKPYWRVVSQCCLALSAVCILVLKVLQ